MQQNLFKKIPYYLGILIIIIGSIFLSGCLSLKYKESRTTENEEILITYDDNQYTPMSSEEGILLGFIVLPYPKKQHWYKKNDTIYFADFYYELSLSEFNFELLKKLYIDSGWVFVEEIVSSQYISIIFKKVDKDLILFIESPLKFEKKLRKKELERNNEEKKIKKESQIIVHETMIVHLV